MLFSSTEQSKKEIKKLENARKRIQAFQKQPSEIMEELKENDLEAYVQANYLYHAAEMPCRWANAIYYGFGSNTPPLGANLLKRSSVMPSSLLRGI